MSLLVDSSDLVRLAHSESILFLIGAYDGTARADRVAQVQAALATVRPLRDHVTPVLVLELEHRNEHLHQAGGWPDQFRECPVVYLSDTGQEARPDGLTMLPSLANPWNAILCFYGADRADGRGVDRQERMADAVRQWMSGPWPTEPQPHVLVMDLSSEPSSLAEARSEGDDVRSAPVLVGAADVSVGRHAALVDRAVIDAGASRPMRGTGVVQLTSQALPDAVGMGVREQLTDYLLAKYAESIRDIAARFAAEAVNSARLRTLAEQAVIAGDRSASLEESLRHEVAALKADLASSNERLVLLESSRIWRMFRPYRRWRAMLAGRAVPPRGVG